MSILGFLKRNDINAGVKEAAGDENAVILDVRTPEEYREERIPGSVNIPLDRIGEIVDQIPDMSTPLFVHCRSGVRSGQAVALLNQMGYQNAVNIGGILDYTGEKERG